MLIYVVLKDWRKIPEKKIEVQMMLSMVLLFGLNLKTLINLHFGRSTNPGNLIQNLYPFSMLYS